MQSESLSPRRPPDEADEAACLAQAQALLDGFQADRRRVAAACAAMADTELVSLDHKRVLGLEAFLDVQRRHREKVLHTTRPKPHFSPPASEAAESRWHGIPHLGHDRHAKRAALPAAMPSRTLHKLVSGCDHRHFQRELMRCDPQASGELAAAAGEVQAALTSMHGAVADDSAEVQREWAKHMQKVRRTVHRDGSEKPDVLDFAALPGGGMCSCSAAVTILMHGYH